MKRKRKKVPKPTNRPHNNAVKDGGMSHRAIAETLGITRNAVWEIEQKALNKLARAKNGRILKSFLKD